MTYQLAEIVAHTDRDEPTHLSDVPFHFSPGERSLFIGGDNSRGFVVRAGWLGLQIPPFDGWQSTRSIEVTYPNGRHSTTLFEVKRNFNKPLKEDKWLWFPAMPLVARPYQE